MRTRKVATSGRPACLLLCSLLTTMGEEEGPDIDIRDLLGVFLLSVSSLLVLTLIFDQSIERLSESLTRKAGMEKQARSLPLSNLPAMYLALLNRYRSEIMVLGCLAFVTWIATTAGIWEHVVWKSEVGGKASPLEGAVSEVAEGAASESVASVASDEAAGTAEQIGEVAARLLRRRLEGGEEPAEGGEQSSKCGGEEGGEEAERLSAWQFYNPPCERAKFTSPEELKELFEIAHMWCASDEKKAGGLASHTAPMSPVCRRLGSLATERSD